MPFLLLDDARHDRARLYRRLIRRETLHPRDLDQLDARLAHGWTEGLHATLRIPYEFGAVLMGLHDDGPPLLLDWYASLTHLDGQAISDWLQTQHNNEPAGLLDLQPDTGIDTYRRAIASIHQHIRDGNTYQLNYTLRLHAQTYGSPAALYQRLRARQPAPWAAFGWHPDDGHTLCLSPELFLARDGQHLHTLPMKGTAPAGPDIEAARLALASDPKNRAENLMIVDLLRNDFSRLSSPHCVTTQDLFHVTQYGSVLQMTSQVNARLRPDIGCADILRATFPCGSITGAPKHRTMQFIETLEQDARGIYTGALGYVEPTRMRLNVAIRTLEIRDHAARFGVGSGITIDSTADDEYRECQLKARFLQLPPEFGLFETLRVSDGVPLRLDAHLARLAHSARAFGIPCDPATIRRTLAGQPAQPGLQRLRITLHPDGRHDIQLSPLAGPPPSTVNCLLHPQALPDRDPLRRHKTTHRGVLDPIWQGAESQGAFDALLFNTRGELLEGARSSVFVQIDGTWHTPPLSLDILPGIARADILTQPAIIGATHIQETRLHRTELQRAGQIILTSSLRGAMVAHLVDRA